MIHRPEVTADETPFVRTLVGHAGLPGSQVVTGRSGSIFTLGDRLGLAGNVYEATSAEYAEPIVLKMFVDAVGADAADLETFAREPLQASALAHPNIVRVLEAGVLENGVPFTVMQKLTGQTLKEWLLHQGGTLSAGLLRDITRAVASALAAAHAVGLIHGAVRPDSIFMESDRPGSSRAPAAQIKLLDFGAHILTPLVRSADDDAGRSERTAFLAPEQQIDGERPVMDARTDQFGLAATARAALAYAPSRAAPAVEAVLRMACSRRPDERFESIGRFVTALEEATAGAALISGKVRQPAPVADQEATPIGTLEAPPVLRRRSAPASAPPRSPTTGTLTRQFFDEGERMSEEAAAAVAAPEFSDSSLKIPVRRRGRWLAGVGVLALAGALGFGLSRLWQPLNSVTSNARTPLATPPAPVAVPPAAPAAAADPQPAVAPAVANAAPANAAPAAPAPVPTPAPVAAAVPAPEPAVVPPSPAAAAAAAAPTPPPVAQAAPPSSPRATREETATARPAPAPRPHVPSPPSDSARTNQRDPLRGYVWSPREGQLVPAHRVLSPRENPPQVEQQMAPPPPSDTEPPAVPPPPLPDPVPAPRP